MTKRKKRTKPSGKQVRKEEFSFLKFILSFKAEIITIICVIVGVRVIASLGGSKKRTEEVNAFITEITSQQKQLWNRQYPSGYKIIALADHQIIETDVDTLPEDLRIDWQHVLVSLVPANPLNQTDEKIKIDIPTLSYAPVEVFNAHVQAVLSRNKKEKAGLMKLGWHNLTVEIIGDDGAQILCLIGFQ